MAVADIILRINMPSDLSITLSYSGRDVDEGTMPVDEVVDALQGFAGAYSKIASLRDTFTQHQLRVAAVRTGSFDLLIQAWATAQQTGPVVEMAYVSVETARWVVGRIASVIGAKKHTKGLPYDVRVRGDGNTVLIANFEGAEISVTPDTIEILRDRLIDSELDKIVAPLREGAVDSVEIRAEEESAVITSADRESFRPDASLATTREMEVLGHLISLNKESSRGSFRLGDGKNVRYHFIGENKDRFHRDFAHKGPVRVVGEVTFDANLSVTHIDIKSVSYLQAELPFVPAQ